MMCDVIHRLPYQLIIGGLEGISLAEMGLRGTRQQGNGENYIMRILILNFRCVQYSVFSWTVRGSNPGGGEIFRTRPDWLWGPPSLLYNGYLVFPGGKAAGAWC
jgi:hypothetical protein